VLLEAMDATLAPIRARAEEIRAQPTLIDQVLGDGATEASAIAGQTMRDVRSRMGLDVYGPHA
jgi:tryptophanyl-tRNA synthetase